MKWTGKNYWLRKLTPRNVAVTNEASVSRREIRYLSFVACCLEQIGNWKVAKKHCCPEAFCLNVALVTSSKIVPPKTILRNIWWQTNKHWWSGQAGTKNCHDHVRQEGAPQINLAWICWQKLNLWCVAAIETKSGVADLLPVNLFCFGPGYE
jgi:hypothetical protein